MEEGGYLWRGIKLVVVNTETSSFCYVLDQIPFSDDLKREFMLNLTEDQKSIKKLGELSDLASF